MQEENAVSPRKDGRRAGEVVVEQNHRDCHVGKTADGRIDARGVDEYAVQVASIAPCRLELLQIHRHPHIPGASFSDVAKDANPLFPAGDATGKDGDQDRARPMRFSLRD